MPMAIRVKQDIGSVSWPGMNVIARTTPAIQAMCNTGMTFNNSLLPSPSSKLSQVKLDDLMDHPDIVRRVVMRCDRKIKQLIADPSQVTIDLIQLMQHLQTLQADPQPNQRH